MGSRVGIARRGSVKVGAVVLAAVFGVFAPGLGPLSATAQEQQAEPWRPVGKFGAPPEDTGKPDKTYIREVDCVRSTTEGHKNVVGNALKVAPPAQRQLRLTEVHDYVRMHSPHGKIGWNDEKNKPIRVAVIDTGVTPGVFFQNRVKPGGDYVTSGNGLEDCDGHGTQVAGIIGANPQKVERTIAFTGVAPDVEIVSIRQSSQNFRPQTKEEKEQIEEERKQEQERARFEREQRQQSEELARKADELAREQEELEREQAKDDEKTESSGAGQPKGGQDPRAQGSGAGNQGTLAQAIVNAVKRKVDVINMSVDACRPNDRNYRPLPGDETELRNAIHYAFERNVVVVAAAGNAGGACVQNDAPEQVDQAAQPGAEQPTGKMPDPNHPPTIVTPPWFSEELLAVAAVDEFGGVANFSMRGPWVNIAAPGTAIISVDPAPDSKLLVNVMFDGDNGAQQLQGTSFAAPYVAGLAVLVRQMYPKLNAREVMDRIMDTAQHPGAIGGRDQFVGYGVIDPMAALTAEFPEELGIAPAKDRPLGSDMPSLAVKDDTPMIVALAGTGAGLAALMITLFAVRTVRRKDKTSAEAS